ncbi:MAG TPA: LPXTG cell wall anchor domain-containing protein [Catenuloplanes sp.]
MEFRRGRHALAYCAAVAISGLLGSPAQAAPVPKVEVSFPDLLLGVGSKGKSGLLGLANRSGADQILRDLTITVDTAGLAGKATIKAFRDDCTTAGTVLTCVDKQFKLPDSVLPEYPLHLDVSPTKAAASGDRGELKISVSAAGLPARTTTATITFGDSVDLSTAGNLSRTGRPGGTVTFPLSVRNAGRTVVNGVVLSSSRSTDNVTYDRKYSNCVYTDDRVACFFPEQLVPGKEYDLTGEITTKVRADAPAPLKYNTYFHWQTPDDAAYWLDPFRQQRPTAGSGAPLRLTEKPARAARQSQTEVNGMDNFAEVAVTLQGDNTADQIAVGGVLRGAVGSTVTGKVGIRNAGPARVDYDRDDLFKLAGIHIVAPSNATIVSLPKNSCAAARNGKRDDTRDPVGAREVLCWSVDHTIEVGRTLTWDIGLRVDGATGTAGSVSVAPEEVEGEPTLDRDTSNNRAQLVVAPPLPGTAGGGTGTGGTGPGGTGGGTLPVTGAQAGTFAGAGLGLVALGVVGFVLARRRRTRFTV